MKNICKELMLNVLDDFYPEDTNLEIKRRIVLLVGLSTIGIFFLSLFGITWVWDE